MAPGRILQIFFRLAIQNQIGIAQWVVVDEIIQLRPLRHGHIQRILDPGAVNGDHSPIPEQQLHAAGVHVEMTSSCIVKVVKGTVSIGSPKSKDSIRDIPVPLNVRPCAIKLRDTTDQFIWESPKTGLPCNPTHFRDVFRKSLVEAGDGRLLIDMSLHAEYTSTPEVVRTLADATKAAGLRMQVHVSETQKEVQECIERHGKTPPVYLADLGLFDVPTTADHCVWLTDEDRSVLAEKGVFVACCPASNAKLGSGIADIKAMKAAGITLTLGTDGVASNNNHNMFQDLYLLALMQRAGDANPVSLSAEELVGIATSNGALSQGRVDCGRMQVGARADLTMLDIDTPWMQPVHTMAENLIYSAQGSDVVLTMVDGTILYENGEYPTIDIEKEIAETCAARERILSEMA